MDTTSQTTAADTRRDAGTDAASAVPTLRPAVDVMENEQGITLYADLPGVSQQDLNISVEDKVLRIEADATLDTPSEMRVAYAEFRTPRYVREFALSNELDPQQINATLSNGLLTLTIPRHEHAKPRKISVEVR